MVVRVAVDLRLFDLLCEKSPQTVKELAAITGAEHELILRFLRVLAGMSFVMQIDRTQFAATHLTKQMTMRSVKAGVKFMYVRSLSDDVRTHWLPF